MLYSFILNVGLSLLATQKSFLSLPFTVPTSYYSPHPLKEFLHFPNLRKLGSRSPYINTILPGICSHGVSRILQWLEARFSNQVT